MINTFEELGLKDELIRGLEKLGITEPTGIQNKAIPLVIENMDIIGQSQTGTGKTLAFLLPIFQKIDITKREVQALILAPTHELVIQLERQIKLLSENSSIAITSASFIGEANIKRQIEKLKLKPQIIVGSPLRILELIKNRKINSQTIKTIVMDEGDRLLDKDNISILKALIKTTLKDRQLILFSATINKITEKNAVELMKEPKIIRIDDAAPSNSNIEHIYFVTEHREKIEILRKLFASIKPERAIVFVNRNDEILPITSKLQYHHISALGINGSEEKEVRRNALESFRKGKTNLLIASDLVARGLDIMGIDHIFNLSLPELSLEYLHRSGRTGRNNQKGIAISIITEKELVLIKKYEKELKIKFSPKKIYNGEIIDL